MSIFYICFMVRFLRKERMVISIPRPIKNKKCRPKRTRTNMTANILLFIEIYAVPGGSTIQFARDRAAVSTV